VVPALAVAQALRAEGAEVSFIGGDRAEAQLVPAAGFPLHTINVRGLSRTSPAAAARAAGLALAAIPAARRLLAKIAPHAVMGGGGYVAGPVGVAALTRRTPLVLTEADSHLGVSNRALAPFARAVCLAFPLPGRDGTRYRVTGRPIPPPETDVARARERLQVPGEATCVLVFGGSLGARSINIAAIEALSDAPVHVLHLCGERDYADLSARALPEGYDLRAYLDREQFADALAAADLVVARSGGSVFEIAAQGLPSILVPYPHAAADHQSENARWMADAGAAIVMPDDQLSGRSLSVAVASLLADERRMAAMARAARSLARPQAARDVAQELLRAARR
jgi:UDP-N-acetylglucosamine--N-acetylmuramyl-(pentapeptide) pyrophosphoryl-undecaprenol N-acetylglucosamine transferase